MGKEWDGGDIAFRVETWEKVFRVLKPGGHLVAFSAPKCQHRMVCAIEDAGFEIRDGFRDYFSAKVRETAFFESLSAAQKDAFLALIDQSGAPVELQWAFGAGFPKSHDISKGIDKAFLAALPQEHRYRLERMSVEFPDMDFMPRDPRSAEWSGWGTALKPAYEPICLARKPIEKTNAANVLKWGVGGLNIDECRVGDFDPEAFTAQLTGDYDRRHGRMGESSANRCHTLRGTANFAAEPGKRSGSPIGRWPANIVHDGSDEVVAGFPDSNGQLATVGPQHGDRPSINCYGNYGPRPLTPPRGDSGSAARFFYSAKASKHDRAGSKHPTVKPINLMRWLCRLVTPKGGLVLDPFTGSGSTGKAAVLDGLRFVGIDIEAEYVAIATARIDHARRQGHQASMEFP